MTEKSLFFQTVQQWMDIFMHRSMRGWFRFVKSTGLSMPQFSILMQLYHKGPCGISDLSDGFDITPAAASQLVDKLVHATLITRTEDVNDRRAKQVAIMPKGRELIEQGMQERYRWMDALEGRLTPEEKEKIAGALEVMTQAVKEIEAENQEA